MTVNTNNLIPVWADLTPYFDLNGNPQPGGLNISGLALASGSNFLFDVTSPYFTNGIRPNVTIELGYSWISNGITDGSLSVYYDSRTGLKLGNTYSLSVTNPGSATQSFTVTDARFGAANGVDIMVTVNGTNAIPVMEYAAVYATSYLGVPPQIVPPHYNGTPPLVSVNLLGPANVVMTGNVGSGNAGLTYWLRGTTNLALPLSQWGWVSTNAFNPDGSFSNGLPIAPGTSQQFYRLQTQ